MQGAPFIFTEYVAAAGDETAFQNDRQSVMPLQRRGARNHWSRKRKSCNTPTRRLLQK